MISEGPAISIFTTSMFRCSLCEDIDGDQISGSSISESGCAVNLTWFPEEGRCRGRCGTSQLL